MSANTRGKPVDSTTSIFTRRQLLALASALAGMGMAQASNSYPTDSSKSAVSEKSRGSLRERLARQTPLLGILQMRTNPALIELAGEYGYEYLLLDGEHGVFTESEFNQTLQAIVAADVFAWVRLAKHDSQALRKYLEMGADAIVVPHVSTVEEAQAMVRAMPANKRACLIVLIESAQGVANAREILALDGVDAAIVGPNDLTTDLGYQGNYAHPEYAQALARIESAAKASGKSLGTIPHGAFTLEVLRARGYRSFILGSELSVMREGMSAQIAKAKAALGAQ